MRRFSSVAPAATLLLAVATLSGCSGQQPTSAAASPSGAIGGKVHYQFDGASATTEVNAVADGASVSGTAVTTFGGGTHTVRLGCARQDGDTWAIAGTTEQSTVPGGRAGEWSAVIVKAGSPQQIGIWISEPPEPGSDCDTFLADIDFAIIAEHLEPVESGALVPPG